MKRRETAQERVGCREAPGPLFLPRPCAGPGAPEHSGSPYTDTPMILHPAAWLVLFIIAAVVVWFTMRDD